MKRLKRGAEPNHLRCCDKDGGGDWNSFATLSDTVCSPLVIGDNALVEFAFVLEDEARKASAMNIGKEGMKLLGRTQLGLAPRQAAENLAKNKIFRER